MVGSGSSLMRLGYSPVSFLPAAFNGLKRFLAPKGRLSLLVHVDWERLKQSKAEGKTLCISVLLHLLSVVTGSC